MLLVILAILWRPEEDVSPANATEMATTVTPGLEVSASAQNFSVKGEFLMRILSVIPNFFVLWFPQFVRTHWNQETQTTTAKVSPPKTEPFEA